VPGLCPLVPAVAPHGIASVGCTTVVDCAGTQMPLAPAPPAPLWPLLTPRGDESLHQGHAGCAGGPTAWTQPRGAARAAVACIEV
jgi:hypothetical protein